MSHQQKNEKYQLRLAISFTLNSVNGDFYSLLLKKVIRFEPKYFRKKYSSKLWDRKKHEREISLASFEDDMSMWNSNGDGFSFGKTGANVPFQSVAVEQDYSMFNSDSDQLADLFNSSQGFTSAYLFNSEYSYVQSAHSDTLLEGKKFSPEILNSIRNTPFKTGVLDDKEYEIRFNPGRMVLIDHTWLSASWKMWFGKLFYNLVPKEKILSFPHAVEIKEFENDIVYVQLYQDAAEPTDPESVFRQWKWQEWIDFDQLIERFG